MPQVSKGKDSLTSQAVLGQLSLALLMPFPRINVSFPRKGKGDHTDDDSEPKVVDWTGRRLTFFHEHRLFPRISIVFPTAGEDELEEEDISLLSDDEILKRMMLDEEKEGDPEGIEEIPAEAEEGGTTSLEDAIKKALAEEQAGTEDGDEPLSLDSAQSLLGGISLDEAIENTMDEEAEPLEVAKSILNADGARDVALPGGVEVAEDSVIEDSVGADTITQGSMVLVEGAKGEATRAVTENLAYGMLESGSTVTYVTTALTIEDFILEMHDHNYRIAQYLPDQKILVIPVYPIIEGKGEPKELLDKLITSTQLQTTDIIFVDSLSDFLGGDFDEIICMRLLEYLRRLSAMGKTIFLVVDDGQKGILSLRLASDLHFALSSQGGKGVQVKRYHPSKAGAAEILRFRVDPAMGLISQPRKAKKK